jgi:hypothetical protein
MLWRTSTRSTRRRRSTNSKQLSMEGVSMVEVNTGDSSTCSPLLSRNTITDLDIIIDMEAAAGVGGLARIATR